MAYMRIDGRDVEIPRHVHKAGGESKIVQTIEEFNSARSEGYFAEPWQAVEDASKQFDAFLSEKAVYPGETFTPEPPAESPEPTPPEDDKPESQIEPVLAEAEPIKRGRGRPRKVVAE